MQISFVHNSFFFKLFVRCLYRFTLLRHHAKAILET